MKLTIGQMALANLWSMIDLLHQASSWSTIGVAALKGFQSKISRNLMKEQGGLVSLWSMIGPWALMHSICLDREGQLGLKNLELR